MRRAFLILLLICCTSIVLAEENASIKFPSPDGRFPLRITRDIKADLIDKVFGKVMVDLEE